MRRAVYAIGCMMMVAGTIGLAWHGWNGIKSHRSYFSLILFFGFAISALSKKRGT